MRDLSCGDKRIFLELEVRRVECRRCGKVKRERLDFLADNPLYTKRFAFYVGRRCRAETIKDVAVELALDWHTVKALDMQYMDAQLKRAGTPGPQVIGVDEISIRKGHTYRIVVSDLLRGRPIWFGGEDRSEASMSQFYAWLGQKKSSRIRLAVMDMWKPFRLATNEHAPCLEATSHVWLRRFIGYPLVGLLSPLGRYGPADPLPHEARAQNEVLRPCSLSSRFLYRSCGSKLRKSPTADARLSHSAM